MLFSSLTFLYLFLPVALAVCYLVPARARNGALLIFSLLFYFYGEQGYTLLLLFSSLSDWLLALYIEAHRGKQGAKIALWGSIFINLMILGTFKYADFFISAVNGAFSLSIPLMKLRLPVGVSFFTFQIMSYTIDVYRGEVKAEKNLGAMAAYVCMFPQLVAGPIVRYADIAGELKARTLSMERFGGGAGRFIRGLGKKLLLANLCGEAFSALSADPAKGGLSVALMGVFYTLQIYFDFDGYSDMAIGLGHMLGFTFPENFKYPLAAKSITDFWRRWHMTLSGWFRDYLYIPLGGNRVTKPRWVLNLLVVWAATGFWHGASWNFLLWGLLFGVLLAMEKLFWGGVLQRAPGFVGRVYTLGWVTFSFLLFACPNLFTLGQWLRAGFTQPFFGGTALYCLKSYWRVLALGCLLCTPAVEALIQRGTARFPRAAFLFKPAAALLLLLCGTALMVEGSFNPFLYFRF